MIRSREPLVPRALVLLYRVALVAYPAPFRRHFGADILITYHQAARGEWLQRRWLALPALVVRAFTDIVRQGLAERLEAAGLRRATGSSAAPPPAPRRSIPAVTVMLDSLLQDLRFATRSLRHSRGLTTTIVLTLALALGAVTTIYTAVHSILLRPLPYPDPERLVVLWESGDELLRGAVSPVDLADWQAANGSFASLGGFRAWRATLTGVEVPESLRASRLSHEVMRALAVEPRLGRLFSAADDAPGAANTVILTDGLWRRQFGADATVIGRAIRLNDAPWTVIGVMPPEFAAPRNPNAELIAPLRIDPTAYTRGSRNLNAMGRLRPGTTLEQARADLARIATRLEAEYPDTNAGVGARLVSLHEETVGDVSRQLYVLLGAVVFVLLIAIANIANLLVARAAARRDEIAVRAALGAGVGRLARQLLTEALLLAAGGGLLALLLAQWGTSALATMAPSGIPRLDQVRPDTSVVALTGLLTLGTGLLFGVVPALCARGEQLSVALRASRTTDLRGAGRGLRRALVAGQFAVALVLMIGAGLLLTSLQRLLAEDPGFEATGVVASRVRLGQAYGGTAAQELFFTQLTERLAQRPEIAEVTTVFLAPFAGGSVSGSFDIEGRPESIDDDGPSAAIQSVGAGFFDLLRMPFVAGRGFAEHDAPTDEPVAVINATAARFFWPDTDPVGSVIDVRVRLDDQEPDAMRRVVGVVADTRHRALDRGPVPIIYVPYRQYPTRSMYVLARSTTGTTGIATALREVVAELDANVALQPLRRLDELINGSVATERFATLLLGTFAFIAVALGCIGIYGLLAYSVAARTNEIGVRMALGARTTDVAGLLFRETAMLAGAGLLLGLAGSYALSRFVEDLLYEVSATDAATFVTMAALLLLLAFAATLGPARRAARVDPLEALRAD